MILPFDPRQGLIAVPTNISGPARAGLLRLALDTGATNTMISTTFAVWLGFDPATSERRVQMTTGSGIEFVPEVEAHRIAALGVENRNFPVLCHVLPPGTSVDGVLGLDFFRGRRLVIDFRLGLVSVD